MDWSTRTDCVDCCRTEVEWHQDASDSGAPVVLCARKEAEEEAWLGAATGVAGVAGVAGEAAAVQVARVAFRASMDEEICFAFRTPFWVCFDPVLLLV